MSENEDIPKKPARIKSVDSFLIASSPILNWFKNNSVLNPVLNSDSKEESQKSSSLPRNIRLSSSIVENELEEDLEEMKPHKTLIKQPSEGGFNMRVSIDTAIAPHERRRMSFGSRNDFENSFEDSSSFQTEQEAEPETEEKEEDLKLEDILRHVWKEIKVTNPFLAGKCKICTKSLVFSNSELKCARCSASAHPSCAANVREGSVLLCNPPFLELLHGISKEGRPLIVFVNPKSGGLKGQYILHKFTQLLGRRQVFDLSRESPIVGLRKYSRLRNLRILVAGGDGTVGWVLSEMDEIEWIRPPLVGILPLGTGNDLARAMGWGGGYNGEDLVAMLHSIQHAQRVRIDRWRVRFIGSDEDDENKAMTNYLSIGSDASIALDFHKKRKENPELFVNQTVNKMWYAFFGTQLAFAKEPKLTRWVDLVVDGELLEIPETVTGIIILNLNSYAGGVDLWGNGNFENFQQQSSNDKLLEIVGIKGAAEMGALTSGIMKPTKIAQGNSISIFFRTEKGKEDNSLAIQIDGEPFSKKSPCTIEIGFSNKVAMLRNTIGTYEM